jgi:hypothetical protein
MKTQLLGERIGPRPKSDRVLGRDHCRASVRDDRLAPKAIQSFWSASNTTCTTIEESGAKSDMHMTKASY